MMQSTAKNHRKRFGNLMVNSTRDLTLMKYKESNNWEKIIMRNKINYYENSERPIEIPT